MNNGKIRITDIDIGHDKTGTRMKAEERNAEDTDRTEKKRRCILKLRDTETEK